MNYRPGTTYCETCLRFTAVGGICQTDDCRPSLATEETGFRRLAAHGYRLFGGVLWHIKNDDFDNFQEDWISAWTEGPVEAFRMLIRHRFPISSSIFCGICHEAEVEFLGDDCYFCHQEAGLEAGAESWRR